MNDHIDGRLDVRMDGLVESWMFSPMVGQIGAFMDGLTNLLDRW